MCAAYLGGSDSLLDTLGMEHQVTRRALVAMGEEGAHRLGAQGAGLVLGQLAHPCQFMDLTQTGADGGRR